MLSLIESFFQGLAFLYYTSFIIVTAIAYYQMSFSGSAARLKLEHKESFSHNFVMSSIREDGSIRRIWSTTWFYWRLLWIFIFAAIGWKFAFVACLSATTLVVILREYNTRLYWPEIQAKYKDLTEFQSAWTKKE